MSRPKGKSSDSDSESSSDEDAENWVQCDRCNKWRRIPASLAEKLADNEPWYCDNNPNKTFASCSVPQELTNEEIDEGDSSDDEDDDQPRLQRKLPAVWLLIKENIFAHRKRKVQDEDEIMICQCKPVWRGGDGCGPDCINRLLCIECTPGYCPCEQHCTNQGFTKKQYAKLEVRRAGPKGFGLFANEPIKAGQFIIEYMGEVLEEEEYLRRKDFYAEVGQRHYYFMNIGNGEVIDACRKGNHARFINHSCEPNCETQKWLVRGELAIGLFALKDLAVGEELTFDYNFERYGDKPMRCHCGMPNCRKSIGGGQDGGVFDDSLVVEPEDASNDYHPIMVTETENDAAIRSILDWRVGLGAERAKEADVMLRLQKLCKTHGIQWNPNVLPGTAPTGQTQPSTSSSSSDQPFGPVSASTGAAASQQKSKTASGTTAGVPQKAARAQQQGSKQAKSKKEKDKDKARAAEDEQDQQRKASHKAASTSAAQPASAKASPSPAPAAAAAPSSATPAPLSVAVPQAVDGLGSPDGKGSGMPTFRGPLKAAFKQMKALGVQEAPAASESQPKPPVEPKPEASSAAQPQPAAVAAAKPNVPIRKRLRRTHEIVKEREAKQKAADDTAALEDQVPASSSAAAGAGAVGGGQATSSNSGLAKKEKEQLATSSLASAATQLAGQGSAATVSVPRRPSYGTLQPSSTTKLEKGQRRRSDIDRRLDSLVNANGRLRDPNNHHNFVQVLRMFNLCSIGPTRVGRAMSTELPSQSHPSSQTAAGRQDQDSAGAPSSSREPGEMREEASEIRDRDRDALTDDAEVVMRMEHAGPRDTSDGQLTARQRARMADLSLLLDVVLKTTNTLHKKDFVKYGLLNQLLQTIGRNFGKEYSVILRKILRVVESLPLKADDLYSVRSAHGSFANVLQELQHNADYEVRSKATALLKKHPLSACEDPQVVQMHHSHAQQSRQRPHPGHQLNGLGTPGMGRGGLSGPPGSALRPTGFSSGPSAPGDTPMSASGRDRDGRDMRDLSGLGLELDGGANPMSLPPVGPRHRTGRPMRPLMMRGELGAENPPGPPGPGSGLGPSRLGTPSSSLLSPPPGPGSSMLVAMPSSQRAGPAAGGSPLTPGTLPPPPGFPPMSGGPLPAQVPMRVSSPMLGDASAHPMLFATPGGAPGTSEPPGKRRKRSFSDAPAGLFFPQQPEDMVIDAPGPSLPPGIGGAPGSHHSGALPGPPPPPSLSGSRDHFDRLLAKGLPPPPSYSSLPHGRDHHQGPPHDRYSRGDRDRDELMSPTAPPLPPDAPPPDSPLPPPPPSTLPRMVPIEQLFERLVPTPTHGKPLLPADLEGGRFSMSPHGESTDTELVFGLRVYGGLFEESCHAQRAALSAVQQVTGGGKDSREGSPHLSPENFPETYSPIHERWFTASSAPSAVVAAAAAKQSQATQPASSSMPAAQALPPPPVVVAPAARSTDELPPPPALSMPLVVNLRDLRDAPPSSAGPQPMLHRGSGSFGSMQEPHAPTLPSDSLPPGPSSGRPAAEMFHPMALRPIRTGLLSVGSHHPTDTPPSMPGSATSTPGYPLPGMPGMPPVASLSSWDGSRPGSAPPVVEVQMEDDMPDAGGSMEDAGMDWARPVAEHHAEMWEEPDADFEAFVSEVVRHRLGKYIQPDHPNRITEEDAAVLYKKIQREVVKTEVRAYRERQQQALRKPIDRRKLESNVKEFVRQSIRRLHHPATNV